MAADDVLGRAYVEIVGKLEGMQKDLDKIKGQADKTGKESGKKFSKGFTDSLAAIGAFAAAKKVFAFLGGAVKDATEAEAAQRKLGQAIAKFPALAGESTGAFAGLNEQLGKTTRFEDDATAAAQAMLARYNLTGKQIRELTPLMQDFASATGQDLPSAASSLGKALMGQGRALKQIGVDFKDTGTVTGNYAQLVDGLRTKVGGFAENEGKTLSGQLQIMHNQFGEFKESLGGIAIPYLTKLAHAGTVVAEALAAVPSKVLLISTAFVGLGLGILAVVKVASAVKSFSNTLEGLGTAGNLAKSSLKGLGQMGMVAAVMTGIGVASKYAAEGIRNVLEGSKAGQSTIVGALMDLANGIDSVGDRFKGKRVDLEDFDAALARMVTEGHADEAAAALLRLGGAGTEVGGKGLKKYADALDEAKTSAILAKDATGDVSGAVDGLADNADGATSAFDELNTALDAYNKKLEESLGVVLDEQKAHLQLSEALAAMGKGLSDNGRTFNENTEAGRDNKRLLFDLYSAQMDYVDALVISGKVLGDDISQTNARIAALEALKRQYPALKTQLDIYIAALKPLRGTVTTTMALNTSPAERAVAAFREKLRLQAFTATLTLLGKVQLPSGKILPMQHGGEAQGVQMVGEAGPEFFVAKRPGWIVPSSQAMSGLSRPDLEGIVRSLLPSQSPGVAAFRNALKGLPAGSRNVTVNLSVNNPLPERATDSLPMMLRRATRELGT